MHTLRVFFSSFVVPLNITTTLVQRVVSSQVSIEEWRHGLEGSGVPFIVWTDHKNLEYIRSAKRLNSRQGSVGTVFRSFLSFCCPIVRVPENIKPDALSRIFDQSERLSTPECIIPERLVVSTLTWEVESKVRTALEGGNASARVSTESIICAEV